MDDREFDQKLSLRMASLPLGDAAVGMVNPWRRAVSSMCWGLLLCSVSIRIGALEMVVPLVGSLLLWLGFRSLRRTNSWLRLGWWISLGLLALRGVLTVLMATPLSHGLGRRGMGEVISLTMLALCWTLWRGLREVFCRAALPPKTGCLVWLMVWYGLVACLGRAVHIEGLPAAGLMVGYLGLLISLSRVGKSLEKAGFLLRSAPVRFSGRQAALVCLGAVGVGVLLCGLGTARFSIEGRQAEPAALEGSDLYRLCSRALPDWGEEYRDVLALLHQEELDRCAGARDLRWMTCIVSAAQDWAGTARITTLCVQMEGERWRVYHVFLWENPPGTAAGWGGIRFLPLSEGIAGGAASWSAPAGALFWEEGGVLQNAPLEEVGLRTMPGTGLPDQGPFEMELAASGFRMLPQGKFHFRGGDSTRVLTSSFPWPGEGNRPGGYVAYDLLGWDGSGEARSFFQLICRRGGGLTYPWREPGLYTEEGLGGGRYTLFDGSCSLDR